MAHDVRSPHIFQDGPGNTASGDQVMDNFDEMWEALDPAFSSYKRLTRASAQISSPVAGGYLMQVTSVAATNVVGNTSAASVAAHLFDLDPAEFAVSGRTTKLNLRLTAVPNAVAPAATFTANLKPVSTYAGASGSGPIINVAGSAVSGSSAAVVSPGAATRVSAVSGDFDIPVAGSYVFVVTLSAQPAANSVTELVATLQLRYV